MPLRSARRRTSAGRAVPSRWTCSSALSGDAHASRASVSGGRRGRLVADGEGGADARGGALGRRLVARVHDRERAAARADLLAEPGDVGEADGVVDRVVLALAAAAELEDGEPEVADRDRAARARRSRARPRARAARAGGGGPGRSSRSAGPPSAAHIAAKRSAAAPEASASPAAARAASSSARGRRAEQRRARARA